MRKNMSIWICIFKHYRQDVWKMNCIFSKAMYMCIYTARKHSIRAHFSTVKTTFYRFKFKIGSVEESFLHTLGGRSQLQSHRPSQQTSEEDPSLGYRESVLAPTMVSTYRVEPVSYCVLLLSLVLSRPFKFKSQICLRWIMPRTSWTLMCTSDS